ncbi:hypothetical protein Hanom_Chr12g01089021 [Helianthus anomalus]
MYLYYNVVCTVNPQKEAHRKSCSLLVHKIKSSRLTNGIFTIPEATRNDRIHRGRIHKNTTFRIFFPEYQQNNV